MLPCRLWQDSPLGPRVRAAVVRPAGDRGAARRVPGERLDGRGIPQLEVPAHQASHGAERLGRAGRHPPPDRSPAGDARQRISSLMHEPRIAPPAGAAVTNDVAMTCRACGVPVRESLVDLGMSPLCESFVPAELADAMEPFYPLHVFVCDQCFLA